MKCICLQAQSLNSYFFEQADKTEDRKDLLKGSVVLLFGGRISTPEPVFLEAGPVSVSAGFTFEHLIW